MFEPSAVSTLIEQMRGPEAGAMPPVPVAQPGAEAPIAPPQASGRNLLTQLGISGPALQSLDAARSRSRQATDQAAQAIAANQETIRELSSDFGPRPTPPTLQEIGPAPEAQETDPMRVFGQTLPLLAMLGGLFVKNNATAALNAGATAIEAARNNDEQAYARARQEWTDSIEAITANNATRLQQYQAILTDRNLDMDERMARLQALAAAEQNALRLSQLASGQVAELTQGVELEMRANEMLTNAYLAQQRISGEGAGAQSALANRMAAQATTAQLVLTQIARARDLATNSNTTGWGSLLSAAPGSDSANLAATIDQIVANIGFDRLQQMREMSPTGGALGNVTERELALLQSVVASLRQSQSRDQFLNNLGIVERQYQNSMANIQRAYQQDFGAGPQQTPEASAAPATGVSPYTTATDDDIMRQLRERGLVE